MQEELLGLLGLHSRPRPQNQETSQAAPKYMLSLYESFVDEETGVLQVDSDKLLARVRDRTLTENNATLSSMNEADEIISFPNQSKLRAWYSYQFTNPLDISLLMTIYLSGETS